MSVFIHKQLKEKTFFQKLFRKEPRENFGVELDNLFAENESDLLKIQSYDISVLTDKYKINLASDFDYQRKDMFSQYLKGCLRKKELTENDISVLNHIVDILKLDSHAAQKEIDEKRNEIYQQEVKYYISSGYLSDEKKQNLNTLKIKLNISENEAVTIYNNEATTVLKNFLKKYIADGRLSPDEDKELNDMAKSLNIEKSFEPETEKLLDKYRLFWHIDNGELMEIASDIHLQTSEKLYFKTHIDWLEERTSTQRINYRGVSARIKIMKGVYYKVGNVVPQRVTTNEYKIIDSGNLYMTNKRFIFIGAHSNKNIPYSKILSFTPYSDGVHIDKDSGKSPFFQFNSDNDLFCVLFSKLLSEC